MSGNKTVWTLVGSLIAVVVLAGGAADLSAAVIVENWDTGYTVDSSPLNSPWVNAGGVGNVPIVARNHAGQAWSDPWSVAQSDGPPGEGMTSRPTGTTPNDYDTVATAVFKPEGVGSSGHGLLALSPSVLSGPDRWRDVPGSVAVLWTPTYGVEIYSATDGGGIAGYAYPGVATGSADHVMFRISVPLELGSQTAVVDWKPASAGSWTNIDSILLSSTLRADNLGMALKGGVWADDVSFSSTPSRPAAWRESWDEGYTTDVSPLNSPWVPAGGNTNLVARNHPGQAWTDPWCVAENGGGSDEGMASRPTGASPGHFDIIATTTFKPEGASGSGFGLFALSPSASAGDDRWRDIPGTLALMWTPGWGTELFSVRDNGSLIYQPFPGAATGTGADHVMFRFLVPEAFGAQTAVVEWKPATATSWNTIGSIALESSFRADHFGLDLRGGTWADDVSFVAKIPEPSSLALAALGVLMAVAGVLGRRRPA